MLRNLLGTGQDTDPNALSTLVAPVGPFSDWKNALSTLGLGLLVKGSNPKADVIGTVLPMAQKIADSRRQSLLLQRLAQDFQNSPALKDPQMKAIVGDLVGAGMVDKAYEIIKSATPKTQEPYTLGKGQIRYGADNKPIAYGTTIDSDDQFKERRLNIQSWSNMPVNQRQALIAQAAGMGIDPNAANAAFQEGKTIADLAKQNNLDVKNLPTPIYPTTTGSLTQIQKRQQALAEMDNLGKTITEWTAPYARRFKGYSVDAIIDAAKGENTDQVAKFLAARGVALDQAAIRTRALGAQVGENVLHDMVQSSMGKINFPEALIGSDLYLKTQKYMDQAIRQSVSQANRIGLSPGLANEPVIPNGTPQYTQAQLAQFKAEALHAGKDPAAVEKMYREMGGI